METEEEQQQEEEQNEPEKSPDELMRDYKFTRDNSIVDLLKQLNDQMRTMNEHLERIERNTSRQISPS